MSQKITSDGAQKGFAVGRGLLAAAETLNYSMSDSHSDSYGSSSQQLGGIVGGGDGKDHESQLPRRVGTHLSNTMKLFASLGLSPTDLDVLAQVPEENISVETLPHLIMQLKNRKVEGSRHLTGDLPSLPSDTSYRGGRDDWGDLQAGRVDRSMRQSQSRTSQGDFGYSSIQDIPSRGYDMLDYGSSSSSRDRQYSELSTDRYSSLGMGSSSTSDDLFMQQRIGAPSQGKIQDFLGVMPQMFPHVCSLCDFDVHSTMEWSQHTSGMRHAENRRVLLQLYPDWDPHMPSGRISGSLETQVRSEGLLGSAPSGGMRQRAGMSSNWGSESGMGMMSKTQPYSMTPKIRSRVVVIKYDRKPVLSNLFALARPFGTVLEHLVLKNKAFLELQTHEEALAMSTYYHKKPATLHGKEVHVYISKELLVIEKGDRTERDSRAVKPGVSPVVFFSNLPRETEKKMELLTISRRFGTVVKHLFLNDEAFVQMSSAVDAEMLVKYYTVNQLTVGRRPIRLNICTKYKTLTVPPGKGDQPRQDRDESSRRRSSSGSRTGYKISSKSLKSSSSKSKEYSSEKTEEPNLELEDSDILAKGSDDEGEGVVEAHDEEEEPFDEGPGEEETDFIAGAASKEQPDPKVRLECEDSAVEPVEDELHDAEGHAMPEEGGQESKLQSVEPSGPETEQENTTEEPRDTDGQDDMEQAEGDNDNAPEDMSELEEFEESEFPENMDEFVTLDELAEDEEAERHDSKSRDKSYSGRTRESGGLRVVNVVGFKRGYGYLDEIMSLAKPFGKVVRSLVLNVRPEAFLELSNEQEARAMVRFYNGNVIPSVCGKAVKIYHSQIYPTIQNGKVVYIGHVPPFKTPDSSFLKIAEPYGKIRRYFMNKSRNECFIEFERGEDAEKFVEISRENPPKFQGKRLVVYISRKYKQLKHGHRPPAPETEDKRPSKRERSEEGEEAPESSPVKTSIKKEDEPPTKKVKEETTSTEIADSVPMKDEEEKQKEKEFQAVSSETAPEVQKEKTLEEIADTSETQNMEIKPTSENEDSAAPPAVTCAAVPQKSEETNEAPAITAQTVKKPESTTATLGPYEPNVPVGVEFVKMGYYCRVCFLFYSNEDTAKKVHCSSQAHYDKLKKHLEKDNAKAQKHGGKN
ncbi:matrin 3-like 1.2 [Hoplias malabaricus]|uniref:matrin 3-like 1.2 n=1 Tax=Hoplias malabaricus TaxID=27720 RepID=UPI0034620BCD